MSVIAYIKRKLNGFSISTRITLGYAACFLVFFFILNVVTWVGAMQVLFAPAEKTIKFSMKNVRSVIEEIETNYDHYNPKNFRAALVPGVVLRAIDSEGNKLVDTDEKNYPSVEAVYAGITDSPPIFAADDLLVSQIGNALIYCDEMTYNIDGKEVTFYFFRTITSEWTLFDNLEKFLVGLDVFGMILALIFGYFLSRRILKPIRTMNDLAHEIAFEKMSGRIPIGEADDELTELAKTLNNMLDRLQGGINQQNEFVANTSHEIRQPLTAFSTWLSLLKDGGLKDPELLNEGIDALGKESQNLIKLLENISILSRSDRKCLNFKKEVLDIDDIVMEIMRSAKVYVNTHKIELIGNESAKIFGNEAAVKQLIRAFLENAVKYTPAGGNIKIKSVVDGGKVLLSISDSGIGISPENQAKIFDRGFRVKNSTIKGSGLGLAMAKIIADKHDIKISVDSALGKGTTFTLTIPQVSL